LAKCLIESSLLLIPVLTIAETLCLINPMRIKLIISIICLPFFGVSQGNFGSHLENLSGIWIATDFKNSFDTTHSMVKSKKTFDGTTPIGFRFNLKESDEKKAVIGFGSLHSHLFHPEVSGYCIQNGDTIREMGNFKIDLNQKDSAEFYRIPDIYFYGDDLTCLLRVIYSTDTTIELINTEPSTLFPSKCRYSRISKSFDSDYQFPNPRDYYIRKVTLVGEYILRDSANQVVSKDFIIQPNGICKGYSELEGKKIHFNTDHYCGPPSTHDGAIFFDPNNIRNSETKFFVYKRKADGQIQLWNYKFVNEKFTLDKAYYTLQPK